MSNPKVNKSLWQVRGLVVFACLFFLVLATGTAQARYRAERDAAAQFQVWEPAQIYLGTVTEAATQSQEGTGDGMVFNPEGIPSWTSQNGMFTMELAVANGISEEEFYMQDQQFRLQLIGSLGLGMPLYFPEIALRVPSETDPETYEVFQSTVSRIQEGTTLYHSVGDGWIIQFRNADGEEPSWILKGGALSCQYFTITARDMLSDSSSLLQPQVVAEVLRG